MNEKSEILNEYVASFCGDLKERYAINYGSGQYNLKRGLRNADGTGVLVGFTKVGSVQGYMVEDGAPVPVSGPVAITIRFSGSKAVSFPVRLS